MESESTGCSDISKTWKMMECDRTVSTNADIISVAEKKEMKMRKVQKDEEVYA